MRATIHLDLNAPTSDPDRCRGPHRRSTRPFHGFQRNQLFLDEMKHFLACVAGDEFSRWSRSATLRQSLRVALAARESLDTGRAVELP